jgi:hypothetical protein
VIGRKPDGDALDAAATHISKAVDHATRAVQGADLDDLPAPNSLFVPRWFAVATAVVAVLFVPWIVYLSMELPHRGRTGHYDVLWVGFDLGMWAVMVALAVAAMRRSTWTQSLAVCAATFLVLDAWFDVVSSASRRQLFGAILAAVLLELPAAAICVWIARNAELIRRRAYDELFALVWARRRRDSAVG